MAQTRPSAPEQYYLFDHLQSIDCLFERNGNRHVTQDGLSSTIDGPYNVLFLGNLPRDRRLFYMHTCILGTKAGETAPPVYPYTYE